MASSSPRAAVRSALRAASRITTHTVGMSAARPRWTREDAREVIAALDRSGKPVSVFAAEHGIVLVAEKPGGGSSGALAPR